MVNFKKLRQLIEIKGNGNIVSREISVSTFIRLHLGGNGLIELHQSEEEKVIFETDENLQEFLSVANAGRTLYVSTDNKFRKPIHTVSIIKIFIRQMDTLYVRNNNGDVTCPSEISLSQPLSITIQSIGSTSLHFVVPSMKVLNQGQGNVVLRGNCETLAIKNQSQGDLDASQMIVGDLTINNMAQGNVQLRADKSIVIKHFGQGFVHFSGNAVVKDVKQFGDGEIKHVAGF
jgi:hypothetical protein